MQNSVTIPWRFAPYLARFGGRSRVRHLVSPQVCDYAAKLLFSGAVALGFGWQMQWVEGDHSALAHYSAALLFGVLLAVTQGGLRWWLGPSPFFADMKWVLLFDITFAAMVIVTYATDYTLTNWLYTTARPYISVENNAVLALAFVRLLWCFRNAHGNFIRMPPLHLRWCARAPTTPNVFATRAFLLGAVAAVAVVAASAAITGYLATLTRQQVFMQAILVLCAGAFPCGVGILRALIATEMGRRAQAKAATAARAAATASELALAEEAQKRHAAEQASATALAEARHTQHMLAGATQHAMRMQDVRLTALQTVQQSGQQMARIRSALTAARAEVRQLGRAQAQSSAALAASQVALEQARAALDERAAKLENTQTELATTLMRHQQIQAQWLEAQNKLVQCQAELHSAQAAWQQETGQLQQAHEQSRNEAAQLQQTVLALKAQLAAKEQFILACGLTVFAPGSKVNAEEARALLAALDPDSPTYARGIRVVARALMLLQAQNEDTPTIKYFAYKNRMVLAESAVAAGLLNQHGRANDRVLNSALHLVGIGLRGSR